jgi:hypothetical protein
MLSMPKPDPDPQGDDELIVRENAGVGSDGQYLYQILFESGGPGKPKIRDNDKPISTFDPDISKVTEIDDGSAEKRIENEITVRFRNRKTVISVPAEDVNSCTWIATQLDPDATIFPKMKDHFIFAMRILSEGRYSHERVFGQTDWQK